MNRRQAVGSVVGLLAANPASAFVNAFKLCWRHQVEDLNKTLAGQVLDYTNNHRVDRRVWSPALGAKRDLYVYLPPGYDGETPHPVLFWMHGFGQDEKNFLDLAPVFDAAVRCGRFPPMVIVSIDGSVSGRPQVGQTGSFYMNSRAGRFEDFVACDVWEFAARTFRLRPEREAHVLAGGSMGGYAAYHLGFKHRHRFGVLAGFIPTLDIRYADCRDRYFADYDPACVMERDHLRRRRIIGRFYAFIPVREKRLTDTLLGRRPADGLTSLASRNPVELLETLDIRPGEFEMFVGYSKKDEFNLDAGVEHFLDVAARRGIFPTVYSLPNGRHDTYSAKQFFPQFSRWLWERLRPFAPATVASVPCDATCERLLTPKPTLAAWLRRPPGPAVAGNPFAPR